MTTPAPLTGLLPLNPEQLARLQAATTDLTPEQLAWVSGYFWGVLNPRSGAVAVTPAPEGKMTGITLISASQTGNARRVAEALRDDLLAANLNVTLVNAGDYKFKQIASEKLLVVVTSTQEKASRRKRPSRYINSCSPKKRQRSTTPLSLFLAWVIRHTNFSVRPVKILTISWRNSVANACWIAWTLTWNTRLPPHNGARGWLMS
ncbi:sulfite reductase subunit alpha [Salmonella enterica subsp. salamae]|nr:sulfite reductase subunit alpha [Salmonella enterica subsp. salamae]